MEKDKQFIVHNIHFTQRHLDNYLDATQICQSQKKMFANWFRAKKTKDILSKVENAIYKNNRHTWISPLCLQPLVEWILDKEIDFSLIQTELDNPFEKEITEIIPPNAKKCSRCQEIVPLDNFWKSKSIKDGYDRRCKSCYKLEKSKKPCQSLEYYHKNKEKCNAKKTEYVEKNREKINAANRKSYVKKMALKAEETKVDEITENMLSNITLMDKNDSSYTVVCRESDGYVDVTNLCKAGGREFKTWNKRAKTKEFLKILEEDIESEYQPDMEEQKRTSLLIKYETGYGSNQRTWVHPKVAINIACWISPKFDVQVSKWVHQLLVVGHVKLTDEHDNGKIMDIQKGKIKYNRLIGEGKEQEAEQTGDDIVNKLMELEEKNRELEQKYKSSVESYNKLSKYLERKRRIQYNSGKCIYVLQHKEFKNCYKVGIANELTSRMSVYNTSAPEDFDLIYHQFTMYNSLVETMVKKKLIEYLYSMNKEWYEVQDGPRILIENIKKAIDYFED